jgi:hypothetical protein
MVEWFLLGNGPSLNPLQLIVQPGMFTFWGTMLLAPLLMMESDFPELKKSFATFFVSFSLFYLLVAVGRASKKRTVKARHLVSCLRVRSQRVIGS